MHFNPAITAYPLEPAQGFRSQRRANRRAPVATGRHLLTVQTPVSQGYQQNPAWPVVAGAVALTGAAVYGGFQCAGGIRHQDVQKFTFEGDEFHILRTLYYKGCFKEKPWVARVELENRQTSEKELAEESFEEKEEAMEWLFSVSKKEANPSATAQAVMQRRRNPLAPSRWPQEPSRAIYSPQGGRIGNPRGGSQPKGMSLKKSTGDKIRNWFFLPDKDRKVRMAKYSPSSPTIKSALPEKLSTRRLTN